MSGERQVREGERQQPGYVTPGGSIVPPPLPPERLRERRFIVTAAALIIVFVYVGSVMVHTEQAPPNALVMRDEAAKAYLAPHCAVGRNNLPVSTIAAAKTDGFHADPTCEKNGEFLGASQTVMQRELARIHLYPKRGTRWRPDGTWKW
jgi:hypothetical protein